MPLNYNSGVFGGMNYGAKRMYGSSSASPTIAPGVSTAVSSSPGVTQAAQGLTGDALERWQLGGKTAAEVNASNQLAAQQRQASDSASSAERIAAINAAKAGDFSLGPSNIANNMGFADWIQYLTKQNKNAVKAGTYDPVTAAFDQLTNYKDPSSSLLTR